MQEFYTGATGGRDRQLDPRYAGVATFMRTPFSPVDWQDVDIGLIGVPFDGGVTNRTGARHGPRAIRDMSSLCRKVNQATGINPYELARIADLGDCVIEKPFHLESSLDEISSFFRKVREADVMPISAGGDHSITLPIFRGIVEPGKPVGMVHFDAHCDTGDDYYGSRFHHGAPFRRAVEEGLLDPKRTIQIGIRGGINSADQWAFSHDSGMRVIYIEEFHEIGVKGVIEEIKAVVGEGPTYVSFDVDGLDPVYAPGTGTPEVGGFSTLEAQLMIRSLKDLEIIGGDVVEVSPPWDQTGNTALVGATLMYEILCVAAASRAERR